MKEFYDRYWQAGGLGHDMVNSEQKIVEGTLNVPLRRLLEQHIEPGSNLLDVGCGDGRRVGLWARSRIVKYTGVDISRPAVETGLGLGLDIHCVDDLIPLPFEDGSFEAVTCIEVLEHLFRPDLAAVEMRRVLRPGGVLIATVPNAANWLRRVELGVFGRFNTLGDNRRIGASTLRTVSLDQPWSDPHIRFFTRASLREMLLRSGFTDVRVGGHEGNIGWFLRALPRGTSIESSEARIPHPFRRLLPGLLGLRLHAIATR